jgi:hypothetical protein
VVESNRSGIYSRFGMKLAERGYVVFTPMISTWDSAERDRVALRSHFCPRLIRAARSFPPARQLGFDDDTVYIKMCGRAHVSGGRYPPKNF